MAWLRNNHVPDEVVPIAQRTDMRNHVFAPPPIRGPPVLKCSNLLLDTLDQLKHGLLFVFREQLDQLREFVHLSLDGGFGLWAEVLPRQKRARLPAKLIYGTGRGLACNDQRRGDKRDP